MSKRRIARYGAVRVYCHAFAKTVWAWSSLRYNYIQIRMGHLELMRPSRVSTLILPSSPILPENHSPYEYLLIFAPHYSGIEGVPSTIGFYIARCI
jgi:hypothetical protein